MEQHKTKLEALLATVTDELRSIGIQEPETGDWIATPDKDVTDKRDNADDNIHADTVEDWNERRATLSELETRYNNIKRALEKIEAGTYGTCEICGAAIEEDRLGANPAARTCKAHLEDEVTL